jgi:hypothetical protein
MDVNALAIPVLGISGSLDTAQRHWKPAGGSEGPYRRRFTSWTLAGYRYYPAHMSFRQFFSALLSRPRPKSEYALLVERVRGGDSSIDFRRLRISYAESPEFEASKSLDLSQQKKAAFAALNSRDFRTAVQVAGSLLEASFVDMDSHFVKYIAHGELREQEQSKFHKMVFTRLLKSITDDGDGKSMATAYHVISIAEEYTLMRVFRMALIRQKLLREAGHAYDAMDVKDLNSGATATLFFNVDIPLRHAL